MGPASAAVPSGWRVRVVTRAESMKYSLGDLTRRLPLLVDARTAKQWRKGRSASSRLGSVTYPRTGVRSPTY